MSVCERRARSWDRPPWHFCLTGNTPCVCIYFKVPSVINEDATAISSTTFYPSLMGWIYMVCVVKTAQLEATKRKVQLYITRLGCNLYWQSAVDSWWSVIGCVALCFLLRNRRTSEASFDCGVCKEESFHPFELIGYGAVHFRHSQKRTAWKSYFRRGAKLCHQSLVWWLQKAKYWAAECSMLWINLIYMS